MQLLDDPQWSIVTRIIMVIFAPTSDFLCYTIGMKRETIFESNPYLRDPESYADQLLRSVVSSTAVEIGRIKPSLKKALIAKASLRKSTSSRKTLDIVSL